MPLMTSLSKIKVMTCDISEARIHNLKRHFFLLGSLVARIHLFQGE